MVKYLFEEVYGLVLRALHKMHHLEVLGIVKHIKLYDYSNNQQNL